MRKMLQGSDFRWPTVPAWLYLKLSWLSYSLVLLFSPIRQLIQQHFGLGGQGVGTIYVPRGERLPGLLQKLADVVGGLLLGGVQRAVNSIESLLDCQNRIRRIRALIHGIAGGKLADGTHAGRAVCGDLFAGASSLRWSWAPAMMDRMLHRSGAGFFLGLVSRRGGLGLDGN